MGRPPFTGMTTVTKKQFRLCIEHLRRAVKGKRFDDAPELFKDIESLKAKARAVYPNIFHV